MYSLSTGLQVYSVGHRSRVCSSRLVVSPRTGGLTPPKELLTVLNVYAIGGLRAGLQVWPTPAPAPVRVRDVCIPARHAAVPVGVGAGPERVDLGLYVRQVQGHRDVDNGFIAEQVILFFVHDVVIVVVSVPVSVFISVPMRVSARVSGRGWCG